MSICPQEAVHGKGCSDVTRKQFLVRDVQMSLLIGNRILGTSEHLLQQTPRGHLNIPYYELLGTRGHLTVRTASRGHTDISLYERSMGHTDISLFEQSMGYTDIR